jgi:hypothetical protein
MDGPCSLYRNQIPDLILGELSEHSRQAIERHLLECRPCAEERELYASAASELRTLADVPVPRHFFVSNEQPRQSPWALFFQLTPAWRVAVVGAPVFACLVAIFAAGQFQVRVEQGTLSFGFGPLPAPVRAVAAAPPSVIDAAALKAEVLQSFEEKSRREKLEWVRAMRAEMTRSNRTLTEQQRMVLQLALAEVERRVNDRLTTTAQVLEEGTRQSLDTLYQTVSLERERDNASVRSLIGSVAVSSEARSSQTDVILDTLLQVADLRTRQ